MIMHLKLSINGLIRIDANCSRCKNEMSLSADQSKALTNAELRGWLSSGLYSQ